MTLAEAQALFWKAARREATPLEIGRCFVSTPNLSAQSRAEVYAGAFFVRQQKALSDLLPKTQRLLGEAFPALAQKYTLAHPGRHAALEHFTNGFGDFLARLPGREQAAALARVEVARNLALRAPADPAGPLTLTGLQALSPGCVLQATESAHLIETDVRTLRLFTEKRDAHRGASGEERLWLMFFRKKFVVRHRSLAEDEALALQRLQRGTTLAALCETFLGHADPGQRAHVVISNFLHNQILLCPPTGEPK